jgi:hypothetical protein
MLLFKYIGSPFGVFLRLIGLFYGQHFVVIWYIFPRFGIFHQEKSGNPAQLSSASAAFLAANKCPAFTAYLNEAPTSISLLTDKKLDRKTCRKKRT